MQLSATLRFLRVFTAERVCQSGVEGQFLCCALSVKMFSCLRRSDRRESDGMGHVCIRFPENNRWHHFAKWPIADLRLPQHNHRRNQ